MVELQWQTKVNRKDVSIVQALTFSDENPKFTIIIWDIFLLKKVMIRASGWTLKLVCTNFISVYMINESYLVSPFTVPCCVGLLSPFCSISVWSWGVITTEEAEGRPKPGCAPFFVLLSECCHSLFASTNFQKRAAELVGHWLSVNIGERRVRQWVVWISRLKGSISELPFARAVPWGPFPF